MKPKTPTECLREAAALLLETEAAILDQRPVTATATEADWLRFLHSFALSDHLGDASDAVRGFAELAGLPMPNDHADLEEWIEWCDARGVSEGVATELIRRRKESR